MEPKYKCLRGFFCVSLLMVTTSLTAGAQESGGRVVPLTSQFVLNGERLDYGFTKGLTFGLSDGDRRNFSPNINGTIALRSSLNEGLIDNIYERRQDGWYLQLQSTTRRQEISVTQRQATDITGFRLQLSVTGACQISGSEAGQICTYTPGLATDPERFDPSLGLPTGFNVSTETGQVISAETQEALRAEGFQRGVAGSDELVGIDFDIPNSGYVASEERAGDNGIRREEYNSSRLVATLSMVSQRLYSNSKEASLSRTIRSFVVLNSEEWSDKAIVLQAAAWLLPGFDARLESKEGLPNLSISNNLFFAANNLRIPANSYSVFQTSTGRVQHLDREPRNISETPPAVFSGFWMGFSPVRNITRSNSFRLERTGDRITRNGPFFNQGGSASGIELPQSSITIVDRITNSISQINLSNIDDLFVQSGLELTSQAALAYSTTTETSYYKLRPHFSLTGNRTDGTSVLRYYGGVLIADDDNAYIGGDYSVVTQNQVQVTARAEAYSKPDRDYYSFAEARILKNQQLASGDTVTFGVGARKEFDRPNTAVDTFDALSNGSVIDVFARYSLNGGASYDLRQRFSESNDEQQASTTVGFSYNIGNRLSLNAQITPISDEDAYIRARVGFEVRGSGGQQPGVFQVQWADIKYDYGRDSVGRKLETDEQVFLASYQMSF